MAVLFLCHSRTCCMSFNIVTYETSPARRKPRGNQKRKPMPEVAKLPPVPTSGLTSIYSTCCPLHPLHRHKRPSVHVTAAGYAIPVYGTRPTITAGARTLSITVGRMEETGKTALRQSLQSSAYSPWRNMRERENRAINMMPLINPSVRQELSNSNFT